LFELRVVVPLVGTPLTKHLKSTYTRDAVAGTECPAAEKKTYTVLVVGVNINVKKVAQAFELIDKSVVPVTTHFAKEPGIP
jgi:hypothetical protein